MIEKTWSEPLAAEDFSRNPLGWLEEKTGPGTPWLLAFCDDGVIWGQREESGSWLLSGEAYQDEPRCSNVAVLLRVQTLLELRVFGSEAELRFWRAPEGFAGCTIRDGEETLPDQVYLLWHRKPAALPSEGGFVVLEGIAGQRHAPPRIAQERPGLVVRHTVGYDEQGQAFIASSRLVRFGGSK